MGRLTRTPARGRLDRLDTVIACAVAGIVLSYFLGASLDWSRLQPTGEMAAEAPDASASSGQAQQAAFFPAHTEPKPSAQAVQDDGWNEMIRRLAAASLSFDGRVAIYLKDLNHNRTWAYHADDLFPSASLIKLPIMIAVFEKIEHGELSLQTRIKLLRRHRTGGSGSLKWYRDGSQFTVMNLLEKMIDESDNTATRMLIETVSLSYLQQQFPRMGLVYTEIYPEGLSLRGSRVAAENYTTAREMASLLDQIYRGQAVSRYSSEMMMDILKRQKSHARLAKGLPPNFEIAHKTGLLRRACHDSAIIFTPGGDYILTVLTGQNRSYHDAKDFITKLGKLTYRYYQGDPSYYAKASGVRVARNRSAVN